MKNITRNNPLHLISLFSRTAMIRDSTMVRGNLVSVCFTTSIKVGTNSVSTTIALTKCSNVNPCIFMPTMATCSLMLNRMDI